MKIFKLIIVIACVLGNFALFISPQASEAGTSPPLIINENDWPPYFFGGTDHTAQGFAKELLQQVIPQAGYSSIFTFYPVKRMHSYIQKGKIDIAVFSYKKAREDFLVYGKEPLFTSGYRPVVRAESGITISSLKDFDSLKIGHLAGLKYSESFLQYIEERQKKGNLVVTTTGDSCIKMLLAGIIDVFVDTSDTVAWRAKQMNMRDKIKILDFDIQTKKYFVTVSKKSAHINNKETFLNTIDEYLRQAKRDGTFAKIAKNYGIQ